MGINATRLFSVMYHRTLNVGRVVSPILIHKAAKKAFDAFGLKKLPTVRSLNEEFARLMAEKKAAYAEYHRAQERMRELLIHKAPTPPVCWGWTSRTGRPPSGSARKNSDGTSRSHR